MGSQNAGTNEEMAADPESAPKIAHVADRKMRSEIDLHSTREGLSLSPTHESIFVGSDGELLRDGLSLASMIIALSELVGGKISEHSERQDSKLFQGTSVKERLRKIYHSSLLVSFCLVWLAREGMGEHAHDTHLRIRRLLEATDAFPDEKFLEGLTPPFLMSLLRALKCSIERKKLKMENLTASDLGYVFETLITLEPKMVSQGVVTSVSLRRKRFHITHSDSLASPQPPKAQPVGKQVDLFHDDSGKIFIREPHNFILEPCSSESVRRRGIFFTPPAVVDYLVDRALTVHLFSANSRRSKLSSRRILKMRILDPAMGAGHFLLAAIDWLYGATFRNTAWALSASDDSSESEAFRKAIGTQCIYGIDVETDFVEIARLLVVFHVGWSRELVDALKRNLVAHNVLCDLEAQSSSCGSEYTFSQARLHEGFDVVIGNPPYLSYSGRHQQSHRTDYEKLRARYGIKGWPASHSIFMLRGVELAKDGGIIAMVVPDQVGYLDGYADIRQRMLRAGNLVEVRYWGEGVFPKAITPSMTFCLRKGEKAESALCVFHKSSSRFSPLNGEAWYASRLRRLYEIASTKHKPIDGYKDIGVHTGNVAHKLVHSAPRPGWVELLEGKRVKLFRCQRPLKWLNVRYKRSKGEYFRIASPEAYKEVDILLRQTASRPIAARHRFRCYFRNSLLGLKVPDGYSIEYLLGILNSDVCRLLLAAISPEINQRAFPQIKISKLRMIPIPDPQESSRSKLARQVEELVKRIEESTCPISRNLLDELNSLAWKIYDLDSGLVNE